MRSCPAAGNISEIRRAATIRSESRKNETFAGKSSATKVNENIDFCPFSDTTETDCNLQVGSFEYLAFALNKSHPQAHKGKSYMTEMSLSEIDAGLVHTSPETNIKYIRAVEASYDF